MIFDNTSHPKIDTLSFDSYTEAIEAVRNMDAEKNEWRKRSMGLSRHFEGVSSFSEAMQLAFGGWPEGKNRIKALVDKLDIQSHIVKPAIFFDVVGDGGFDMGRVLTGVPENMMDWRETEIEQKSPTGDIVRIVFNCVASGMVSTDVLEKRGAAVLALVDALETAGKRVELDVIYYIGASGKSEAGKVIKIIVPVKRADFAAQIDQIAFALVHPAFMRVFMFSLLSLCGQNGKASAATSCGHFGAESRYPIEADIYIDKAYGLDSNFESAQSITQWIKNTLHKFGIRLDTDNRP